MNTKGRSPSDIAVLERISSGIAALADDAVLVDTGNLAVTAAITTPIAATFKASTLYAVNLTDEIAFLTVTDAAGLKYLDASPIQPRAHLVIPFGGLEFAGGLKWNADIDNALRAQMVGVQ